MYPEKYVLFFIPTFFPCSVGVVSSESGLLHVDVIVLDEVHYLSDISRGTVWEEIVRASPCQKLFMLFLLYYVT